MSCVRPPEQGAGGPPASLNGKEPVRLALRLPDWGREVTGKIHRVRQASPGELQPGCGGRGPSGHGGPDMGYRPKFVKGKREAKIECGCLMTGKPSGPEGARLPEKGMIR